MGAPRALETIVVIQLRISLGRARWVWKVSMNRKAYLQDPKRLKGEFIRIVCR